MRNQFSIPIVTDEKAMELLDSGWSLTKIGKVYSISRGCLSKRLKQKGYSIINKQNERGTNNSIFKNIDSEEKAYWLGFLYADGSISYNRNVIEVGLKESDINHLEKFKRFIEADNKIYHDNKAKSVTYAFNSKKIKKDLIALGCVPKKSEVLTFPKCLKKEFIIPFIRGYFDGDGCLTYMKSKKKFLVPIVKFLGTNDMLVNIQNNFNLSKRIYQANTKINSSKFVFECGFGCKDSITILNILYANSTIHLDRKYKRYLMFKQHDYAVPIEKSKGL